MSKVKVFPDPVVCLDCRGAVCCSEALHDERSKLQQQIDTVDAAIKILGRTNTGNPKNTKSKRKMSTASRRKMSFSG
jgi:hypothetical protein